MPIYEYVCRKCGNAFEHLARTLSEPAPKCPQCGAARPAKQLSVFSASGGGQGMDLRESCPAAEACRSEECSAGKCPMGACPR